MPVERGAHGVLERRETQACGHRARRADERHAGRGPDRRAPDRQAGSVEHALGLEEFGVHPVHLRAGAGDVAAGLEQLPDRGKSRRRAGVEHAPVRSRGARDHEAREIAHVEVLDRIVGRAGREHVAALRHAPGPVREPVGVVAGTHEVRGPHDRVATVEVRLHDAFAECLQPAVGVPAHYLDGWIGKHLERRILGHARCGKIRIYGDRGDEQVVAHPLAQQLGGQAHVARHVAGVVDDHVPVAALE